MSSFTCSHIKYIKQTTYGTYNLIIEHVDYNQVLTEMIMININRCNVIICSNFHHTML